ncbi:MAG: phosphate signaling complex protein PhoU [Chloroflexota bacterium]|nr:phosphate signaling complex protein PhoU [Anaerolineae bacterium]
MSPRETFDRALGRLRDDLLMLGSMTEKAILRSIESLKMRDLEAAREIIADDIEINNKRFDIEEQCIQLIVTQQPVAGDLRAIIAVLHISVDLERMADHAEGIARINILMGDEPLLKPLIDLPRMAEKATDMLHRSLISFVEQDVEEARRISDEDDEVDSLYNQVYRELVSYMLEDPRTTTRANYLLWVAHNLERVADRVTNICERVIFLSTGEMQELNVSKLENYDISRAMG